MIAVIAELLDTLAHDIPNLPGASCRGHAELFDVAGRHDPAVERAKAVCASCPVLGDCRRWLASLPRLARPCGVVAGRYVAPPKLRPAYEPRPRAPIQPGPRRRLVAQLFGAAGPGYLHAGDRRCDGGGY
jgi:hypothetical protein